MLSLKAFLAWQSIAPSPTYGISRHRSADLPEGPTRVSTADGQRKARATVRLRRAKGRKSIEGMNHGNTVMDGAPCASCSVGQALPLGWSQLDELAAQRLELGGSVVVLDVLRVVRDGVDQPVP